MHIALRPLSILFFALAITGCGGGSGASTGNSAAGNTTASSGTVNAGQTTLAAGSTFTMPANASLLVPAGTVVTAPNGSVITINGSGNTISTQVGAMASAPASATGPATNLVTTTQTTSVGMPGTSFQLAVLAGSATTNLNPTDGTGSAAIFWGGGHMAIDAGGNIVISDRGALRKVTQAGVVTTLVPGYQPADWEGIAIDSAGNIYGSGGTMSSPAPVVWGASVNKLTPSGVVQSLFANWETSTSNPSLGFGDLVIDSKGNLFMLDSPNNRIVKFTAGGNWSVFAGSGASGSLGGLGASTSSALNSIFGLAMDDKDNLFAAVAGTIQKIAPDGTVTTVASHLNIKGGAIAVDQSGNIYAPGMQSLYRISGDGTVTTYPFTNTTDFISSMVTDKNGNLFIATRGTGAQIFKISF